MEDSPKQKLELDDQIEVETGVSFRLGSAQKIFANMLAIMGLCLSFSFTFSFNPFGQVKVDFWYLYLFLAMFLPLMFLYFPARKADKRKVPWYDVLAALICVAIPAYFASRAEDILFGWQAIAPAHAVILGTIYFVLVLEAARRAGGSVFCGVILFFALYPLFSDHMPGLFYCPMPFSFFRIITIHMFSAESIMGEPLRLLGQTLIGYYIYAQVIQSVGAGKFFTELSMGLFGKTRATAAKTSVISSGLFGSISGSGIANVLTTGTFTIPAMKKEGLPPYFAGAVETVASNGGIFLPPVMGAVGFLMAQFLAVPYTVVAIVAAVPAVIYYMVIFMQVDAYAGRHGIKHIPTEMELPPIWLVLLRNWHILASVAVLTYLMFAFYWVDWAPWIASLALFIMSMFKKEHRGNLRKLISIIGSVGRSTGNVIALFAAIGMVMGSFVVTGLAYSFPYEVTRLAGGNIPLLLFLGAAACFVLGMGIPIIGVYIFLAIVLVPPLVAGGLNEYAVHFFVVYCACWASITPPVATVAYVAADLAGAPPMRTGWYSVRLASAKFILPFFFVINPALILRGASIFQEIWAIWNCIFGMMEISAALEGYMWFVGSINLPLRIALFIAGFLVALPELYTTFVGYGISGILFITFLLTRKARIGVIASG